MMKPMAKPRNASAAVVLMSDKSSEFDLDTPEGASGAIAWLLKAGIEGHMKSMDAKRFAEMLKIKLEIDTVAALRKTGGVPVVRTGSRNVLNVNAHAPYKGTRRITRSRIVEGKEKEEVIEDAEFIG